LNNDLHYSSKSPEYKTPKWLFEKYNAIYHFDLDVCATHENALCDKYFTKEDDALTQEWKGVCWMNPPYGREIIHWLKKAHESDATVVCLVPSRTDTKWWHKYVMKGDITFLNKRLEFEGAGNKAPFPSTIVIFEGVS